MTPLFYFPSTYKIHANCYLNFIGYWQHISLKSEQIRHGNSGLTVKFFFIVTDLYQ